MATTTSSSISVMPRGREFVPLPRESLGTRHPQGDESNSVLQNRMASPLLHVVIVNQGDAAGGQAGGRLHDGTNRG